MGETHWLALFTNGLVSMQKIYENAPPIIPSGLSNVIAIAAGDDFSLAARNDGSVVSWNADAVVSVLPNWTNVNSVAAYHNNRLALKDDGTVISDVYPPPPGLGNVIAISAGRSHSTALKSDGTVVVWGNDGQTNFPPGLTNVMAIASGDYHNIALKSDGTVVRWGTPVVPVPGDLSDVRSIAAGPNHDIAVKEDGSIIVWGNPNDYIMQARIPPGLTRVINAAAGFGINLALVMDNSDADPDDDGLINWREFQLRRDPASFDYMHFNSIPSLDGSGFHLTVNEVLGRGFALQGSTNFVDWTSLTNFLAGNDTISFNDATATNLGHRFYRATKP
jgi:hypothetical protein